MEQDGSSFWADIKKYEDTLDRDPNSYCFAPLSELYRKLGMVDDAIMVAKRGCELHPEYVGGYMALGRAYHEKGMNAECRDALEKVIRVTPDNLLALRILSQIYIDAGDISSAEATLQTILVQNPEDVESRMLLSSLKRIAEVDNRSAVAAQERYDAIGMNGEEEKGNADPSDLSAEEFCLEPTSDGDVPAMDAIPDEEAEEILELTEADIYEEPLGEEESPEELPLNLPFTESVAVTPAFAGAERKDPLTTATLAELYVSQGFPERALEIYRELLAEDPENDELKERLAAVEKELNALPAPAGEELDETAHSGPATDKQEEATLAVLPALMEAPDGASTAALADGGSQSRAVYEEQIIHTLEMWLENIKRRR
ncbi:MAG TPA: tetratricopeptide repeat protein [Geobacteraceae bacterium]|nr:tetratricopeptide repeat protein [Geobacteraceae bacterium]